MNPMRSGSNSTWQLAADAVLHSYALVYFSHRRWMGALLLLCTLLAPAYGLMGLAGILISLGAAVLFGFDREPLRNGTYLLNSLLVALALAHIHHAAQISLPVVILLLVVCSVLTLFVTVALSSQLYRHFGLPSLSLPFVAVQSLLFFLLISLEQSPSRPDASPVLLPDIAGIGGPVRSYLESLGTLLFVPHAGIGLIVLAGLLAYSRLAVLLATVGFAVGMATVGLLPVDVPAADAAGMAFNYLFCGLALGGVFFIPSRSSLLLAAIGSAICAVLAVAELHLFAAAGFPPMALPLNVVVLLVLCAMKLRAAPKQLHPTPFGPLSPEENFRRFRSHQARFPDFGLPSILCPFAGQRVVTQGVGGAVTHRGPWRFALDFEVVDGAGRKSSRSAARLEDNYTFNTPVLAPGNGTVVRAVDYIEDRAIGSSNFDDNWGNLVIVQLDSGHYVKLCHLRRGSLRVHEGQRVRAGELLGCCGNSGRSPVPHLHVQLQSTPHIGAATLPFRLRHYIEQNGRGPVYRTAGMPADAAAAATSVPHRAFLPYNTELA